MSGIAAGNVQGGESLMSGTPDSEYQGVRPIGYNKLGPQNSPALVSESGRLVTARGRSILGNQRRGPGFRGSMGRQVATWSAFSATTGTASLVSDLPPVPDNAPFSVRLVRNATASAGECSAALAAYSPLSGTAYPSVGIWVKNPTTRLLDFRVRFWNAGFTRSVSYGGSIRPGLGWQFMTLSPKATVAGNWIIGTDQINAVRVEQPSGSNVGPNGEWVAGDELLFGPVYADIKGRARFLLTFDDVPATVIRPYPLSASAPVSGRSAKQMLDYYGFKGSIFVVPDLMDRVATMVTTAEVQALVDAGWTLGAHSDTHPIDAVGAGLRLLGPYGYNRSRALRAANATEAATALDCRVVSTNSATGTFTTENSHLMSTGGKLVFYDPLQLPTGCTLGVTYYFINTGATTFKLATTAGNANSGTAISLPANWAGSAEWRWPGSAPDHTAIKADLRAGNDKLTLKGFKGHTRYLALPQGGWDHYVRQAVQELGYTYTRGVASTAANARTLHVGPADGYGGNATGGTSSSTPFWAMGWPEQSDALTSDQGATLLQLQAYVDECIANGYTGANYHHSVSDSPDVLDGLLAYLRTKVDAGQIEVVTLEELDETMDIWGGEA